MLHLFKQSRPTINDKIPECGIIDDVVAVSDEVSKSEKSFDILESSARDYQRRSVPVARGPRR
jgi:hypothetical protein